jgi:hypothetical protein
MRWSQYLTKGTPQYKWQKSKKKAVSKGSFLPFDTAFSLDADKYTIFYKTVYLHLIIIFNF